MYFQNFHLKIQLNSVQALRESESEKRMHAAKENQTLSRKNVELQGEVDELRDVRNNSHMRIF